MKDTINDNIMRFSIRHVILLIFTTLVPQNVHGYSTGAPNSPRICASMTPGHGVDPQTSASPYKLTVAQAKNGQAVSAILEGSADQTYTGFMVQARNAINKNQIIDGVFAEDKQSQIKSCNSNKGNTLTHRSGLQKTRVETVWTPPDSFTGEVVLRTTFVEAKEKFWIEHDSDVFRFRRGRAVDRQTYLSNAEDINNNDVNIENSVRERGQSPTDNSQRGTQNAKLDYSVCDTKFCLGLGQTSTCVADKSCELLLSGGYANKEEGLTEFELSAVPKGNSHLNKYYSMAFSMDSRMGDDLVTDCYVTSEGKVKVGSSVNIGRTNELNDEFKASLQSIQSSFTNGVVMCKWKSHRKRTANGKEWDLLNNKYHILLAMGNLEDDTGAKDYHDNKIVSSSPIALEQVGAAAAASKPPTILVRIHGVFMTIAWMGTVSLAIVFARYYKQTWVSSTLCGVKIWFAFHRGLMVTSVVLMISAQICIFYFVGVNISGPHQIVGALAFTLALLNPLGALFRPHPDADNRYIFNWAHWGLGNVGHILAIVAIFLSTGLELADLPKTQVLWTIISFVLFYVIIHLILQFHTFFMQNRTFNLVETHDIAMQDMSRGSDDPDMGTDGPGTGFRRFILGLYCVGILAFVIAMVLLITLPTTSLEKMGMSPQ